MSLQTRQIKALGRSRMKAQTVGVKESTGRILCCTIFRPSGKKLLAKGHVISEEDIRLLETEGMQQVWVTELEEGEISDPTLLHPFGFEKGCSRFGSRSSKTVKSVRMTPLCR